MNLHFLAWLAIVPILSAACWYWVYRLDKLAKVNGLVLSLAVVSSLASITLLIFSVALPLGHATHALVPLTQDQVELTPYRLILRADDHEFTYTDARTVVQAHQQRPTTARLTYYHNAWGQPFGYRNQSNPPQLTPLFGSTPAPAK
jgi:hypothetical protein